MQSKKMNIVQEFIYGKSLACEQLKFLEKILKQ